MAIVKEKLRLWCGDIPFSGIVPDILQQDNLQNKTVFGLSEYDEIYEAYGQRKNAYPYRQQNCYGRHLRQRDVEALILENDCLRAEFLPGFGGRLWRLYDKTHRRELVYTNDCLRASNLAVRNAWFSGGVEWNCGIIGHGPYTMDSVFFSQLAFEGRDVLRLYAYERVRGVVYQVDFWLDDRAPALNCHMAVTNPGRETVPMYWWTNIASALYPGGRILVPAHQAYTYREGTIVKVPVPNPEPGVDVSRYETIPNSRDYFFENDPDTARWIAHVDRSGFGLLHSSGDRLRSRKLFVWGQNPGAHHWQRFLTEQAGEYLEIQAGLSKTQYGCIPMAPRTTWEWSERLEPLQLTKEQQEMDFSAASRSLDSRVQRENRSRELDDLGGRMRRMESRVLARGTGDGWLAIQVAQRQGRPSMTAHLDFEASDRRIRPWQDFLRTGILEPPRGEPEYDPYGAFWLEALEKSVKRKEGRNWYSYYCLALLQKEAGRPDLAKKAAARSLELQDTPWGEYVMAVLEYEAGRLRQASESMNRGFRLCRDDLSYAKAGLELLMRCGQWRTILRQIEMMPQSLQRSSRVGLYGAFALVHMGRPQLAEEMLHRELEDVREGEDNLSTLWRLLGEGPIPPELDFDALSM